MSDKVTVWPCSLRASTEFMSYCGKEGQTQARGSFSVGESPAPCCHHRVPPSILSSSTDRTMCFSAPAQSESESLLPSWRDRTVFLALKCPWAFVLTKVRACVIQAMLACLIFSSLFPRWLFRLLFPHLYSQSWFQSDRYETSVDIQTGLVTFHSFIHVTHVQSVSALHHSLSVLWHWRPRGDTPASRIFCLNRRARKERNNFFKGNKSYRFYLLDIYELNCPLLPTARAMVYTPLL